MLHRALPLFLIALAILGCTQNTSANTVSTQGSRPASESVTRVRPAAPDEIEFRDAESQVAPSSGAQYNQVAPSSGAQYNTVDEPEPLPFALSEGQPGLDSGDARPPVAETTALTQEQLRNLLTRLPSILADDGDVQQYRLPGQSLPPPRPGLEVTLPFPPPQAEAAPDEYADSPSRPPGARNTTLDVLRFSPEGEVPLAPQLSVTFNQPMVPLSSRQELAQEDVPLKLSPAVRGHWRWVGTKTLLFEADVDGIDRMPMATEYTVEIPAGAESANGKTLADAVSWTFRTPTASLQTAYPTGGAYGLEPVFFAAFDQRIDPTAIIEHAQVTARGRTYAVRLASADEIAADARVRRLSEGARESRWLAFMADEPLPRDATVTVTFAAGTPSAEGPLVTAHPQSYSFQTYAPFALRQHECGWGTDGQCPPFTPWRLQFSNPIDVEAFDPALISTQPELSDAEFDISGNSIWIAGNTQGRTTYNVAVSAGLTDVFGQAMEEDVQVQFRVGAMEAFLIAENGPMTIPDPYSEPTFPLYTVNVNAVKARAFRVEPEQYLEYMQWRNDYRYDDPLDPPGEPVMERTLKISSQNDVLTETLIDLSDALAGDTGHLILHVEPEGGLLSALFNRQLQSMRVISWIQVTQIGLDAFVDADAMRVWANHLEDGAPLDAVDVALWPQDARGITDETGSALLTLPKNSAQLLIARNGDDVAFLPENHYFYRDERGWSGWRQRVEPVEARYYVFDDRQMYRPGETVSIKGWMRQIEHGPQGDVGLFSAGAADRIAYRVSDSLGNEIATDEAPLNSLGGFHFQFNLPENINLGFTEIELMAAPGGALDARATRHYHSIQVQEFRRPEFEVSARVSEGPHTVGGHALATVSASYFAGGPLPAAEVEWSVHAMPGSYNPPNWSGFTFGKWMPWWRFYDDVAPYNTFSDLGRASFASRANSAGEHSLRIDFLSSESALRPFAGPVRIDATATILDVNRQAWSSSAGLLVHPADRYIGLRTARYFVARGEPLTVDIVVTDIDGNAIEGHSAVLRAARLNWQYHQGEWREIEKDAQECAVETTAATDPDDADSEFASCVFKTTLGGQYRITATVIDAAGRRNQTELTRWVSGGGQRPPSRNLEQEEIQLIPDGENYAPGDTAAILVQAPFFPAEGIATVRRQGLVSSERFSMDAPTYTLHVPIEKKYIPNIHVQVNLIGAAVRTDDAGNELLSAPRRPAYARGSLDLSISPLNRTLRVDADPQADRLEPGGETTIDVTVRDANGEPVADAEFAVVVVDEAILALTGYQLIDPIRVFYSGRDSGVRDHHNRADVLLASPQSLQEKTVTPTGMPQPAFGQFRGAPAAAAMPRMEMAMMDMAASEEAGGDEGQPIRVRLNYDPLALFAPELRTDENGQASVPVTLPDNLTRYRVMLVAAGDDKFFGSAESSLTARLPLMVRPSAPRFLNFGDNFELPVVLQNQTDEPMEVHVGVQATNAGLTAEGPQESEQGEVAGYAVTVPANDRVEVRFPTTTISAGAARFQFGALDANQPAIADAAAVDLPVFTPATTEAFAVYGEIDESGAVLQPVRPPAGVIPNYGGLEVTMSSTALQTLTDAFIYLMRYPYECSEQIASRILGVAALQDALTAFETQGIAASPVIAQAMERDLQTLQAMQDNSGGFPIWRRGDQVWPYHSVHVAHALARAQLKGYAVPDGMISRSLDYLRNIEGYISQDIGISTRRALVSYALYVRKLLRDNDPAKARNLVNESGLGNLSLESIGWLLFVLTDDPASQETVQKIRRFLKNRVTETAATATISTGYSDGEYLLLYSSRRADAVLLEALIVDQPQSDLITKLARGLLGHRTQGRWANTQENVWVLLAMERFFNTFESQTPDFMARIWLGEQYAGGHAFRGRTLENVNLDVPMPVVQNRRLDDDGDVPLIVQKDGQGRLYYRLGLRYAPTDLRLDAADRGFTVERIYEAVDDPQDVRRDKDGVWHIRAGARVQVKLTMVAPSRRLHVALVDPLPAGLEILNPTLAVTGDAPDDPHESSSSYRWLWGSWYQHQNLRDERAEAFSSFVWAGVYEYRYMARATTPGAFVAPPAKAEEMYAPETFGRSATDWVVIN